MLTESERNLGTSFQPRTSFSSFPAHRWGRVTSSNPRNVTNRNEIRHRYAEIGNYLRCLPFILISFQHNLGGTYLPWQFKRSCLIWQRQGSGLWRKLQALHIWDTSPWLWLWKREQEKRQKKLSCNKRKSGCTVPISSLNLEEEKKKELGLNSQLPLWMGTE